MSIGIFSHKIIMCKYIISIIHDIFHFFKGNFKQMEKKIIFRGIATALITPFKNGDIDYDALSDIIEMQIGAGISALVIGGTTAEAATLSDEEFSRRAFAWRGRKVVERNIDLF